MTERLPLLSLWKAGDYLWDAAITQREKPEGLTVDVALPPLAELQAMETRLGRSLAGIRLVADRGRPTFYLRKDQWLRRRIETGLIGLAVTGWNMQRAGQLKRTAEAYLVTADRLLAAADQPAGLTEAALALLSKRQSQDVRARTLARLAERLPTLLGPWGCGSILPDLSFRESRRSLTPWFPSSKPIRVLNRSNCLPHSPARRKATCSVSQSADAQPRQENGHEHHPAMAHSKQAVSESLRHHLNSARAQLAPQDSAGADGAASTRLLMQGATIGVSGAAFQTLLTDIAELSGATLEQVDPVTTEPSGLLTQMHMRLFQSSTSAREIWRMLTPKVRSITIAAMVITAALGLVGVAPTEALLLSFLAGSAVVITLCDLRHRIIPDLISLPLVMIGIGFAARQGREAVVIHMLTAAGIAALLYILQAVHFRLRQRVGLGLGDVKLIAAAAMWIGPLHLADYLLAAALPALVQSGLGRSGTFQRKIPFGPALAFWLWIFGCPAALTNR